MGGIGPTARTPVLAGAAFTRPRRPRPVVSDPPSQNTPARFDDDGPHLPRVGPPPLAVVAVVVMDPAALVVAALEQDLLLRPRPALAHRPELSELLLLAGGEVEQGVVAAGPLRLDQAP